MMHDRINRRMEALQKQIDAEKAAKGLPQNGLTTPSEAEKWAAKQDESHQLADFQDTAPGDGIPVCTSAG
jgi:hypothetical protein